MNPPGRGREQGNGLALPFVFGALWLLALPGSLRS